MTWLFRPRRAGWLLLAAGLLACAGVAAGGSAYAPGAFAGELAQSDGCHWPCWRGITPGQTRRAPVHAYLNTAGYRSENPVMSVGAARTLNYDRPSPERCAVRLSFQGDQVALIQLRRCPVMTVGDALLLFGSPQGASALAARLHFQGSQIIVETDTDCRVPLSPHTRVLALIFAAPREVEGLMAWAGFKHRGYYRADPRAPTSTCPD